MTPPALALEQFEGPLDLLLALVRQHRVDITGIPIAEITRQYLDYLKKAEELDLELGSEFAFMAATLIQIKSSLILPPDPEIGAPEPDPRQDLIRQLLNHGRIRQAAEFLHQQLEIAGATWTKGSMEEFQGATADDEEPAAEPGWMNLTELLRLARKAVDTARAHEVLRLDTSEVTVEEMIGWLKDRLAARSAGERFSAEPLFCEQASPGRQVALFLAMLELSKDGAIRLDQQDLFTPIFIDRIAAV